MPETVPNDERKDGLKTILFSFTYLTALDKVFRTAEHIISNNPGYSLNSQNKIVWYESYTHNPTRGGPFGTRGGDRDCNLEGGDSLEGPGDDSPSRIKGDGGIRGNDSIKGDGGSADDCSLGGTGICSPGIKGDNV